MVQSRIYQSFILVAPKNYTDIELKAKRKENNTLK